ncbi:hypothetical protein KHS38_11735 [Mucilaginibacter sp. Bleaf8]|uniref:hypothetical protein n=1 Tax=Mucilaginibacter sp. Bleaf8 TaxID=2834430 RepID=UPI001BCBADE8|nr:hypothetical protein [Mucilaginibacter sp. Bleaf8]MBS7565076.1 hypothetical protein [Mucilaginibacter sp. Bleaf8]
MKNLVIKLEINGKLEIADIHLPESWNEVPAADYPHLASLYMATDKKMSEHDKFVRAFVLLTWHHWRVIEQLLPEEMYELVKLVEWVFNQLDLTVNHQPEIKIGKQVLIGPADGMENLRFAEWCTANTYAQNVPEDETLESMRGLAACLYRPAGEGNEYKPGHATYRGDRREKFNEQLVDSRMAMLEKLDAPTLQGIYVWFCSCRYQLFAPYEKLKQPADGGEANGSWLDVYDDLRGDPKFGGPEKLEDDWLTYILFSLDRNKDKMDQLKSQYDI